jgi:L-iditol 2-dehydrogenase
MMKAAYLFDKLDLRVLEVPVPNIGDHEILLKVKGASVCGTDVRMQSHGYRGVSPENPLLLGHEVSGVIHAVGEQIPAQYQVGMRVTVAPNMGCGYCDLCIAGNTHLCPEYKALGINMPGGFAEYVVIPEAAVRQGNVVPIPDHVSFEEAALAEPLACIYNAFQRLAITLGDEVLVIGAGPIGLMHALMAQKAGAGKVIVSDIHTDRLAFVEQHFPGMITVPVQQLDEAIKRLTEGRGVDVCITANPSPQAQIKSLELTAINGRINFFGGIPSGSDLSKFDSNLIHYRQLIVSGTTRQSVSQFRKVVKLIADGVIPVDKLITHRYTLEELPLAIEQIKQGIGIKHAVIFEEGGGHGKLESHTV